MADKRPMFHTRFNVAETQNKKKIYDRHDKVDRLSYVDSTVMVKRLIAEGRSLNAARAAALRSGLYSDDIRDIDSAIGSPIPVYPVDPVIASEIVSSLRSPHSHTEPETVSKSVSEVSTDSASVKDAPKQSESQ